jgi:hypothetical protein
MVNFRKNIKIKLIKNLILINNINNLIKFNQINKY